jgi:HlyD family secretion protein
MSAAPTTAPVESPERPVPVPSGQKPSRIWLWLLLAALVLSGGYAAYRAKAAKDAAGKAQAVTVRTAKVVKGTLERTVRLAGQTSARNFQNIVAPQLRGPESNASMTIQKLVKSGSLIKKGELLIQIDAQAGKDHVDDVTDTVQQSVADVASRRAEQKVEYENLLQTVRVAKAEYEKAKLEYQPAEIRTPIERELLKLSLDEAEARYSELERELAFRRESQRAELKILEYTTERHTRHRDRHARDLQHFTMLAPISGLAVMNTVFRGGDMTQVQEGDVIYPGQQLLKIVDPQSMQVETNINQAESSQFRIGQKAVVTLDAFADVEVTGKVYSIGALATRSWRENYFVRNIPLRISLDRQDARIIPDLSASVLVTLDKVDDAVIVPLDALKTEGGKQYAMVKTASGFERREVQTGLQNDTHAAVTSGLQPGDEVRIN